MSRGVVRVFPDLEELTLAAAEEFVRRTTHAVAAHGPATVALAGGSTPRRLYHLLSEEPFLSRLHWERIHFFWGDERHVPPESPDSNYRMAYETMLGRAPVPAENIHRIRSMIPDAPQAAAQYESDLSDFFSSRGLMRGAFPRFDLVLLGMGADGHTASLFPGTDAVRERIRLVVSPWVEKLRSHRITLTSPVINSAACVVFLVAGEEKAETLRSVLEGEPQPDVFPSQTIRPDAGDLLWFVDRGAASGLSG